MDTAKRLRFYAIAFAALLTLLYISGLTTDSIAPFFGIQSNDEGVYLLSAKNHVLFGSPHWLAGDRWKPELMVPLLNELAATVMSPAHLTFNIRFAVTLFALAGAALLAHIASRLHGERMAGMLCFIALLLNPTLYFYARLGLSEGLQFFLLAIILALLFALFHTVNLTKARLLAAGAGAMTSLLFIAKISSVAACAGLSFAMALLPWLAPARPGKWSLPLCFAAAAIATLTLYFTAIIPGEFSEWWRVNIDDQAKSRVPLEAFDALRRFTFKMPNIMYYLCLMPCTAFFFLAFAGAADRARPYLHFLWVVTAFTFFAESFTGGDMRRSFFSLMLLGALFAFTLPLLLKRDFTFHLRPWTMEKRISATLIALHIAGVVGLLYMSVVLADMLYLVITSLFLLLTGLVYASAQPKRWKVRLGLLGFCAFASLTPMGFQSFMAPSTEQTITASIETYVPPDELLLGSMAPWRLLSLHRRMILTNCDHPTSPIHYANPISDLPDRGRFYLTSVQIEKDLCAPADYRQYQPVDYYALFVPVNQAMWPDVRTRQYNRYYVLYEKRP